MSTSSSKSSKIIASSKRRSKKAPKRSNKISNSAPYTYGSYIYINLRDEDGKTSEVKFRKDLIMQGHLDYAAAYAMRLLQEYFSQLGIEAGIRFGVQSVT